MAAPSCSARCVVSLALPYSLVNRAASPSTSPRRSASSALSTLQCNREILFLRLVMSVPLREQHHIDGLESQSGNYHSRAPSKQNLNSSSHRAFLRKQL